MNSANMTPASTTPANVTPVSTTSASVLPAKMRTAQGFAWGRRLVMLLAASVALFVGASGWQLGMETPAPAPQTQALASQDPLLAWQERIRRNPEDADAYAGLGLAYLQRVRESHDSSLYAQAGAAFDAALARDPQQIDALAGRGALALALHDFAGALEIAGEVITLNPYKAAGYGIKVDALVELGRYAEAVTVLQQMVDLRPDLESYSRVAYLRELHGDSEGAMEAMRMAASTAVPGTEPSLWTTTQLGNLAWGQGQLDEAELLYRAVLRGRGDEPFAQFGLARIFAARGRHDQALAILAPLAARLPMPEFLIALGDLYAGQGQLRQAREQVDLVRAIQRLNAGVGMNVDLELAVFEVLHGDDPTRALAAARSAYAARPTIFAADALAWALHRNGDDVTAWRLSQEALRLGTRDPLLHAHAAAIADSLGDAVAAEKHWAEEDNINRYHSPWRESGLAPVHPKP